MKVDRYSFFVQAFDDDGDNATAPVPYLMLHRGIDIATPGGVDEADAVPIAAGVEQLQLACVMNADMRKTAPPAILGVNNPNEPPFGEAWDADGMQPGRERPAMKDSYPDAKCFTSNPANVRLVRARWWCAAPCARRFCPATTTSMPRWSAPPWEPGRRGGRRRTSGRRRRRSCPRGQLRAEHRAAGGRSQEPLDAVAIHAAHRGRRLTMALRHASPRGASLIMVMIALAVVTLLVVGAIAFTGSERTAAVLQSRSERTSGCLQAARNLFISKMQISTSRSSTARTSNSACGAGQYRPGAAHHRSSAEGRP